MFSTRKGIATGATIWATLNAKTGGFIIPGPKGEDGKATKDRNEVLGPVFLARIFKQEQEKYQQPGVMETLVCASFRDAQGNQAVIKMTNTPLGLKLLGHLNAADLTKPVTMQAGAFEAGTEGYRKNPATGAYDVPYKRTEDEAFITLTQKDAEGNDVKIAAKYSDDANWAYPKAEPVLKADGTPVLVNGKPLKDHSKREAFMMAFADTLAAKVAEAVKVQPKPGSTPSIAPDASDAPTEPLSGVTGSDILGEPETAAEAHGM
jgi:hypothetical protein